MLAEDLKIYKKLDDISSTFNQYTINHSKMWQQTYSKRAVNLSLDCIELITEANMTMGKERLTALHKLQIKFSTYEYIIRKCVKAKELSQKQYLNLVEMISDFKKQLTGWKKHTEDHIKAADVKADATVT